jgi:hypothetical protein
MTSLIVFSLSVYFLYHLLSRSDLLRRPREWAYKVLPGWVTYVISCAFCFTWWVSLFATFIGAVPLTAAYLLAAPVVNLLVDQVLQWLFRTNEPPMFICSPTGTSFATSLGTDPLVTVTCNGSSLTPCPTPPKPTS